MPSLNWIGKEAVVNHDKEVPFKLLKKVKSVSVGDNSENLIIHGDNLEALKALMPYYAGKVKCIYIDPPYNTGNEGWVYNDKVNSPKIKQWLGKVVGGESEDLTRHDKWLCMMYPRLKLLRDLLSDDGAIFISIDDNEHCNLRGIADEIFGDNNFITTIIWQKMDSPKNTAIHFSEDHDYILVYAKNSDTWRPRKLPRTEAMLARYKNPDNDSRGAWLLSDLAARNPYSQGRYSITTPSGRMIEGPPAGSYWRVSKEKFNELDRDGRIWWGEAGTNRPGIKRFLSEVQEGVVPQTLWTWKDVGSNRNAKQELSQVMSVGNSQDLFITPKPTKLIKRILQIATNPEDTILDSFAGSGTTGHATLDLNKEDGGSRKFIMVEIEDNVAREMTAKRIKLASKKFNYKEGFEYCELDKPLFNKDGQIEDSCDFKQFATYIYFTETQSNIDPKKIRGNFIGATDTTEYYLLYKGRDKNDLDKSFLKKIKATKNKKVIYADRCLIDDSVLAKHNITFKQIPYEVKVY